MRYLALILFGVGFGQAIINQAPWGGGMMAAGFVLFMLSPRGDRK